MKPVILPIYLI